MVAVVSRFYLGFYRHVHFHFYNTSKHKLSPHYEVTNHTAGNKFL